MATRGWHSVYPLIAFNDPREVIAAQPTFFCCEVLFLFLAAIGIRDALRRPRGLLTFVACLIGGASVELVTILHQEVGNFYHSQATIMLFGRREPLYMLLGCYGWIAHAAMMLSHKFGGTLMQQACLGGLLGAESWALLDMVGARLLWWTWHNSEPLYADREGGVPVASSFWILASMASLPITLHYCCPSSNALWGLVAGPLATLGLMHVPFMLIFHPLSTFLKFHAAHSLWLFRLLCFAPLAPRVLAAWTTPKTKKKAPRLKKVNMTPFAIVRGEEVKEVLEFRVLGHRTTFDLSARMAKTHVVQVAERALWPTRWVRKNLGSANAFSYVASRVAPSALFASELHHVKLSVAAEGNTLARATAGLEPHKWQNDASK